MRGPEFKDRPYEELGVSFCGPRALQILYDYHFGVVIPQRKLADEIGTDPVDGTPLSQMTAHLTRNGLSVMEFFNADWDLLTRFVNDPKYAVIVDYWYGDNQDEVGINTGHFDVPNAIVYNTMHLVDGTTMTRKEFESRWHDYEEEDDGTRRRIDRYFMATYLPRISIIIK